MLTLNNKSSRVTWTAAFAAMLACGVAAPALAQVTTSPVPTSFGIPAPATTAAAVSRANAASISATGVGTPAAGVSDPGVRGGAPGAGGPLAGLGGLDLQLFKAAAHRFNEIDSVSGVAVSGINDVTNSASQVSGAGLGPGFNGDDCAECHAQPAIGGTGPAKNPQIAVAQAHGATNTIPPFITANGPTREARFINLPNGSPDGSVHDLFTIAGRTDAKPPVQATTCTLAQPNFPQQLAANNVIFRIPISLFGDGQIENVSDTNLMNDAAQFATPDAGVGIVPGVFNLSGNDGTIMRFGWKAQNKSLMIFAGEAYNVEQGVSNELFPNERLDNPADPAASDCVFNPLPEDNLNETATSTSPTNFFASNFSSDIENFSQFMRLLAGPTPAAQTSADVAGDILFQEAGCVGCHVGKHTTSISFYGNQSNVTFIPFSDIALHDMGTGLQDQVTQGAANGQTFRTAPLWGVGQRIFLLHDGRTTNLLTAIEAHASSGSEANGVIEIFNEEANATQQQEILDFVRSL
jgi:CxxC motif-containing protein (DUF1111 family)